MRTENKQSVSSVAAFVDVVRTDIATSAPDLLDLFDVYAGEAHFGAMVLAEDLRRLPQDAKLLEIGAGSLLLSCMLRDAGYDICALEPIGSGFSHFARMQEAIAGCAARHGILPRMLRCAGEELDVQGEFDYAFSINVMEHVRDYGTVLERVRDALKPGGHYRFICPNYAFPYEPHFNMPTLLSRSLTERVMKSRILQSKAVVDPEGTWQSLNWITVSAVRRVCRERLRTEAKFNAGVLQVFLQRAMEDVQFQSRRGPLIRGVVAGLFRSRLISLTRLLPTAVLPVMDCTISRPLQHSK